MPHSFREARGQTPHHLLHRQLAKRCVGASGAQYEPDVQPRRDSRTSIETFCILIIPNGTFYFYKTCTKNRKLHHSVSNNNETNSAKILIKNKSDQRCSEKESLTLRTTKAEGGPYNEIIRRLSTF